MSSNLIAPEPDMLLLENVEVGPRCDLCKLETVTNKYKKTQQWKARCATCLEKRRDNDRNRKRRRK